MHVENASKLGIVKTLVSSENIASRGTIVAFIAYERIMNALVRSEIAVLRASIVTLAAGEPVVSALVTGKRAAMSASKLALVAREWMFARMNKLVSSEKRSFSASIFALVARERPLARMSTLVNDKIAALSRSKLAFVAGERTLAGMSSLVTGKRAALRRSILALVAGEWTHLSLAQRAASDTASQFIFRSIHVGHFPALVRGCIIGCCGIVLDNLIRYLAANFGARSRQRNRGHLMQLKLRICRSQVELILIPSRRIVTCWRGAMGSSCGETIRLFCKPKQANRGRCHAGALQWHCRVQWHAPSPGHWLCRLDGAGRKISPKDCLCQPTGSSDNLGLSDLNLNELKVREETCHVS